MDQEQKIKISLNTAYISGIFSALIAILLTINWLQVRTFKPLETKTMEVLVERVKKEPDNEDLKKEVRDLDLLARKAFFTNLWQVNTGRYLLLFGGILFIVSLRYYQSLIFKRRKPEKQSAGEEKKMKTSLRWMAAGGGLLFLIAFLSSFAVMDYLKLYKGGETGAAGAGANQESIEVINVTEVSDSSRNIAPAGQAPVAVTGDTGKPGGEVQPAPAKEQVATEAVFPSLADIKANHNGFRGPLGQGVSYASNIPVDWDGATGKNILWKTEISKPGVNSPVVWKDKLFVAGADQQARMVYCLDRNTGSILWQKEVTGIPGSPAAVPKATADAGLSAPSVTTDGKRVYAIFANGDIAAFTFSGDLAWGRSLGLPDNHYGYANSPIVWNNKVIIQFDSNKGGRVLALNSKTGETVWDTPRNVKISWASPVLAEINGKIQVVLSADPLLAGYDPESGKELWTIECIFGEVGSSPAFSDGLVYVANEYARLAAVKPGPLPSIVWENDEYLPEVPSPVASDGLLILATNYGVLVCYDAKTGTKYWEREFNNSFFSSPVIADNKIYVTDVSGQTHILKLSKTLELIAEPKLADQVTATPAFANGRIYMRSESSYIYCIGQK